MRQEATLIGGVAWRRRKRYHTPGGDAHMSGVGAPAVYPRTSTTCPYPVERARRGLRNCGAPYTPGGDEPQTAPICLGLGPQLCVPETCRAGPYTVARARRGVRNRTAALLPYAWRRRTAPFICLGLGPQLYGPETMRQEATTPLATPICLGLGPQQYGPAL
eukprot:gene25175-biopygen15008